MRAFRVICLLLLVYGYLSLDHFYTSPRSYVFHSHTLEEVSPTHSSTELVENIASVNQINHTLQITSSKKQVVESDHLAYLKAIPSFYFFKGAVILNLTFNEFLNTSKKLLLYPFHFFW